MVEEVLNSLYTIKKTLSFANAQCVSNYLEHVTACLHEHKALKVLTSETKKHSRCRSLGQKTKLMHKIVSPKSQREYWTGSQVTGRLLSKSNRPLHQYGSEWLQS